MRLMSLYYGHASPGVKTDMVFFQSFCEEDYRVTPYIAEFINTLSNVIYGKAFSLNRLIRYYYIDN